MTTRHFVPGYLHRVPAVFPNVPTKASRRSANLSVSRSIRAAKTAASLRSFTDETFPPTKIEGIVSLIASQIMRPVTIDIFLRRQRSAIISDSISTAAEPAVRFSDHLSATDA